MTHPSGKPISRDELLAKVEALQNQNGVYEHRIRGAEAEAERLRQRIAELEAEPRLPNVSGHCGTTHTACDCVLARLRALEGRR